MNSKKPSFVAVFTITCLTIIVLITVSLSVMFFIAFHNRSYKQLETTMRENVAHVQDMVVFKFKEWSSFIAYTAISIAPDMAREPADTQRIRTFFERVLDSQSDVWLLYCSNNLVWNEPGGYAVFSDRALRSPTWNNTTRPWFTGAKAHPGNIAYADPYIASINGKPTIAVSTNVYDETGRDLGVVSGNVSIDFLQTLLESYASLPQQRIFLLNKAGLFITNHDAVLEKDFFTELGIAPYRKRVLSSTSFFEVNQDMFIYSVSIPGVDWILLSTVPGPVVFTGVHKLLIQMIGINGVFIFITVILCIILTRLLKMEREEIAAMKDNLKVGFFLIDHNYTIQGQYSRALEHLLSAADLKGKNFMALLSASTTKREVDTLKDYFDLAFNGSVDQDMLDDVNPIRELSYISVETGEEKILSCGFTRVIRKNQEVFILGDILDITTEKTLQKQLTLEENKRKQEMSFLFEVIQVEPQVLREFIEDAEYGFKQIEGILNNQERTFKVAVVDIYQAVHAIKSNAVILGLQIFGNHLHNLESEIKNIQEQQDILAEDMHRLTGKIEQVKQDKDKLIATIHQIRAFTIEGKRNHQYVLVESLNRACTKVSADLQKKVRFEVEKVDPQTIERGPRRVIQEVLMQLIRNAVYHGIESGDERSARGKEETGRITLSITLEGDTIHITLSDDGRGLDFDKIRNKAKELHIIQSGEDEEDRDILAQVMFAPGFSTAEQEGLHAGRGMGLHLVQSRIRELGGIIKVHSEYGRGTVFTIALPLIVNTVVNQAS